MKPYEPCLCGDPLCPKCFDIGGVLAENQYAVAMQTMHVKLMRNYCDLLLDAVRADNAERQGLAISGLNSAIDSWRGEPDKAMDDTDRKVYRKALSQIANASAGDYRRGEDDKGYWYRFACELRQVAKDALYYT